VFDLRAFVAHKRQGQQGCVWRSTWQRSGDKRAGSDRLSSINTHEMKCWHIKRGGEWRLEQCSTEVLA